MADIAFIFHWPPAVMDAMDPAEFARWWRHASDRWKTVNHQPEK